MPDNVYIKIDGTDHSSDIYHDLLSLEVDQSLFLPNMLTIHLNDEFDQTTSKYKWADTDTFALGKKVEIALESDEIPDEPAPVKATIFKGEITSLEPVFTDEGTAIMVIRGYDKSHRLHRGKKIRTFADKKDSDLVEPIAKECGLTAEVDSTTAVHKIVIQDNQTNMEFLQERAKRIGYFVYVQDDKLHFRHTPQPTSSSGGVTLTWGENLSDFRVRLTTMEQVSDATARGWDLVQKKAIDSKKIDSARDKPDVGTSEIAKEPFGDSSDYVTYASAADVDAIAQGAFDEMRHSSIQAEGTLRQGDPRICAGAKVGMANLGHRFSGDYRITRAIHYYVRGDYNVRFEVTGHRANTVGQLLAGKDGNKYGVTVGIVTQNNDPENLGRVRVKYPSLADDVESWWIRLVTPMAGSEMGFEFIPQVGDEVLVAFEQEDINRAFILGSLWNGKDKPPQPNSAITNEGKVEKRIIRSSSGHTILFDDTANNEKFSIIDKTEINKIEIDSKSNSLEIMTDSEIKVHTKDGHTIVLNNNGISIEASSKDLTMKGQNIKIESDMDVNIKAGMNMTVEGGMATTVKGSTGMDLDGGAKLTAKGGVVMIN